MLGRGLETQDNVDMYGNICPVWILEPGGLRIWELNRKYYFPLPREYLESRLADPETLPPRVREFSPWFVASYDEQIYDASIGTT
jgi:hypothetical protein